MARPSGKSGRSAAIPSSSIPDSSGDNSPLKPKLSIPQIPVQADKYTKDEIINGYHTMIAVSLAHSQVSPEVINKYYSGLSALEFGSDEWRAHLSNYIDI